MASVSLSSLCLTQNPISLSFSSIASDHLRFGSPTVEFGSVKKYRRDRAVVCRASSVVFRNLDADDFRHPLDKQNTLILRAIPGLNELGKILLGSVAEQVLLLEEYWNILLVSKDQAALRLTAKSYRDKEDMLRLFGTPPQHTK
ncbi:hypothetical protein GBA52_011734 [Prunus armeniaca]|nr:hypothetical protein GBA52_011734 [Prunus armeniaca]